MKYTVLIVCSYSEFLERYLASLRKYYTGECNLFLCNASKIKNSLILDIKNKYNIIIHEIPNDIKWLKHCEQWRLIEEFCKNYDGFILRTDVFDVIFQSNPFNLIDVESDKFYVGSEGVHGPHRGHTISWVPNDLKKVVMNKPLINSGCIASHSSNMLVLSKLIQCNFFQLESEDQAYVDMIHKAFSSSFIVDNKLFFNISANKYTINNSILYDEHGNVPCVVHACGAHKKAIEELML
jgi:mRNA-degrading endonuclease HigB of HigAB toxin-antitoxin module